MIIVKILKGALSRKHHSQMVLVDDNPTGFILKNADSGTTEEYRSIDFIGVFQPSVSRNTLERELKFQGEL